MRVKGSKLGDVKRILKFAWIPKKIGSDYIFMSTYSDIYEFKKKSSAMLINNVVHLNEYNDWVKVESRLTQTNPTSFLRKTKKLWNSIF